MQRIPFAGWILALGFAAGPFAPPSVPAQRLRSVTCDYVLLPQSNPGGCVSTSNPQCSEGGPTCCRHWHEPLTWNEAVPWVKPTGFAKGPSYRRYYTTREFECEGPACEPGELSTDYEHFVLEDTLVTCSQ